MFALDDYPTTRSKLLKSRRLDVLAERREPHAHADARFTGKTESVQALASSGMLFTAASVVLLAIVYANVSGPFLARAAGRRRCYAPCP